jgi:hypothetical protein
VKNTSYYDMTKNNMRCNYDLTVAPEYEEFMNIVGHRKITRKSPTYSLMSYEIINNVQKDNYKGIILFMLYKRNMITQINGVEKWDTQVLMVNNFTAVPSLVVEMVKY